MIGFCDIHKSFGSNIVLDGINFEIYPNEITAIVGPNGMGKTTILNLICGMLLPDYGTIKYENCSSKSCFVVLSGDNNMYAKNTVKENIYYIGRLRKLKKEEIDRNISLASQYITLYHQISNVLYERLSYGQKRLMTIFGAMIADPQIITFDEPTEGLDLDHKRQIAAIISSQKENRCIILTSHDSSFLCNVADRILFLNDGKIVKDIPSVAEEEFVNLYKTIYGIEVGK